MWTHLTFALSNAAGVQVGSGCSLRAGLTLQLTLLVLVGAQPAALTLVIFQREVCSHWALDCNSTHSLRFTGKHKTFKHRILKSHNFSCILYGYKGSTNKVVRWVGAPSVHSPHILPFSTEPGLQNREGFLLSKDLGSATIISEDTWKLDSGCLASVLFRRLVSCSKVRRSLFWLATSIESFLDRGRGMLAGRMDKV